MFEDSLVESQDRIRTRSKWFAIGSFLAQAGLLLLLILYPLLHPLALPRQSIERLLIAPPPPRAPAPIEVQHSTAVSAHSLPSLQAQLQAPTTIPTHIVSDPGDAPPPSSIIGIPGGDPTGVPGVLIGSAAPPVTVAHLPVPKH